MQAQPGGLAPPRPATASGWRSDLLRRGGSAGGTLRRSRWGRWRPTARLRTSLLQASKAPLRGETPLNVGAAAEADAFVCSRAQPDVFGAARMLVVTGSWRKAEWNGRLPMTDHPRFERLQGSAETMHRRYHGGKLVAVILWLADLWMAWRRVGRGQVPLGCAQPRQCSAQRPPRASADVADGLAYERNCGWDCPAGRRSGCARGQGAFAASTARQSRGVSDLNLRLPARRWLVPGRAKHDGRQGAPAV